jgi:hypothetical protein
LQKLLKLSVDFGGPGSSNQGERESGCEKPAGFLEFKSRLGGILCQGWCADFFTVHGPQMAWASESFGQPIQSISEIFGGT